MLTIGRFEFDSYPYPSGSLTRGLRLLLLSALGDFSLVLARALGINSAGKIFPLGVELDCYAADIGRAGVADPGLEPPPLLFSPTIFG